MTQVILYKEDPEFFNLMGYLDYLPYFTFFRYFIGCIRDGDSSAGIIWFVSKDHLNDRMDKC